MRIQVVSNLHLERYAKVCPQLVLKPAAPTLVLAGNVGSPHQRTYRDLLFYCSRNWDRTIVVGGDLEKSLDPHFSKCITTSFEFSNVHFLQKSHLDRAGITFLGAHNFTDDDLDWISDEHPNPVVLISHHCPSVVARIHAVATIFPRHMDIVVEVNGGSASDSESALQSREEQLQNSGSAQMR